MRTLSYQSLFAPQLAFPLTNVQPWHETGGDVLTAYPKMRNQEARASGIAGGSEFVAFNTLPMGWEVQPPQPPHPRPERSGAAMIGESGTEAPFVFVPLVVIAWGFEQPSILSRRIPKIAGVGDDGTAGRFVNWANAGWEVHPVQPRHPRPERSAAAAPWVDIVKTYAVFFPFGWEVQPPQSCHRRPERSGAAVGGEGGIEAPLIPPATSTPAWGFEHPFLAPRVSVQLRGSAVSGRSMFTSFSLLPMGWEVAPHQPQHPRPEKAAGILVGEQGDEAKFVFVPPSAAPFLDAVSTTARPFFNRRSATKGQAAFAFFAPYVPWWEIQPPQPNHPRCERGGAIMVGEAGIEATFVGPQPIAAVWGHEQSNITLRQKLTRGMVAGGRSSFSSFGLLSFGWEVQPVQPRHLRPEKAGGIMRGDDGVEGVFTFVPPTFVQWGYEFFYQPPHRRRERAGATQVGEQGTEAPFVPPLPTPSWGFEYYVQPPRRRWERAAAGHVGEVGIERPFAVFFPHGWPVQPPQPPHPRPERAGAIMRGEDGIENKFSFIAPVFTWAFDQSNQPGRKRFKAPAPFDDGIAASFRAFHPLFDPVLMYVRPARRTPPTAILVNVDSVFVPPFIPPASWAFDQTIFVRWKRPDGAVVYPFAWEAIPPTPLPVVAVALASDFAYYGALASDEPVMMAQASDF